MSPTRANRGLFLGYLGIAAGVVLLARGGPHLDVGGAALAGVGFVLALVCARKAHVRVGVLLLLAAGLRVPAWIQGPVLSDDLERYVWEGELVLRGVDPYAHAPDAPELAAVRAELPALHARVNHPDVAAVYPPLAQTVNAAGVWLARALPGDRVANARIVLRCVYLACDLGVLLLLARWCARRGRSAACAVAWGWCPFLAFEFAGSGHLDALAVLLLVGAFVLREEGRAEGRASVLLALAALVKLLPLVAVPAWLRGSGARSRSVLALCVVLALGAAPLFLSNSGFAGLSEYGTRWEGFNLAFRGIASVVERLDGGSSGPEELRLLARRVAGTLWLAIVVAAWFQKRDAADFTRIAIAAFLVLTPVLHPWYLAWILPFVALRADAEWVVLAAAAPLLYAPLAAGRERGDWTEPSWLWPCVALPFFALLVARVARARWGRARASAPAPEAPSCGER